MSLGAALLARRGVNGVGSMLFEKKHLACDACRELLVFCWLPCCRLSVGGGVLGCPLGCPLGRPAPGRPDSTVSTPTYESPRLLHAAAEHCLLYRAVVRGSYGRCDVVDWLARRGLVDDDVVRPLWGVWEFCRVMASGFCFIFFSSDPFSSKSPQKIVD